MMAASLGRGQFRELMGFETMDVLLNGPGDGLKDFNAQAVQTGYGSTPYPSNDNCIDSISGQCV